MRVCFWGVRGSIPAPLTPAQIQNKISAVVQRISKSDIVDNDSRERFISTLPAWLFGTVGSNTSCVEVETEGGDTIIFDAGTGIRNLGIDLTSRPNYKTKNTYHLFLSHFHWDHIQGLPFFNPAYDPKNKIIIYSTRPKCKEFLEEQMIYPYFPISMLGEDGFAAKIEFRYIEPNEKYIRIGNAKIGWHRVRHPGGCNAYSVIDAQYTFSDSIQKEGWGHSTYSVAIDFAVGWSIKRIALFHHEPTYSDKKIFSIKQSADCYKNYTGASDLDIFIAQEGQNIYI